MNIEIIRKGLKDYKKFDVDRYCNYCQYLLSAKNKDHTPKYTWFTSKPEQYLIDCFREVAENGLVFDGEHITLQNTGISFDYQAYKNKMLLAYPDSIIDDDLVYEKDTFEFKKYSGKVTYSHDIADPFSRNEEQIIGGYCVIKNKRGEFLTMLSKADIDKHRKVAKTDYIWKQWFVEMARKTVLKKACKKHFDDIYQNIMKIDNENSDIENPLDIELSVKESIEEIQTMEALEKFYKENKEKHTANAKGFNFLINKKKKELENENS